MPVMTFPLAASLAWSVTTQPQVRGTGQAMVE